MSYIYSKQIIVIASINRKTITSHAAAAEERKRELTAEQQSKGFKTICCSAHYYIRGCVFYLLWKYCKWWLGGTANHTQAAFLTPAHWEGSTAGTSWASGKYTVVEQREYSTFIFPAAPGYCPAMHHHFIQGHTACMSKTIFISTLSGSHRALPWQMSKQYFIKEAAGLGVFFL